MLCFWVYNICEALISHCWIFNWCKFTTLFNKNKILDWTEITGIVADGGWSTVDGSCSKSFWDLPLVEGPGRHVHPKTTTFCLVLGFTPSREACRAHQSQNDLEQGYSAILITAKAQRPPPQIAIFWKISKNRGLELLFDPPGMRNGKKQDLKLPFELSTIIREGQTC